MHLSPVGAVEEPWAFQVLNSSELVQIAEEGGEAKQEEGSGLEGAQGAAGQGSEDKAKAVSAP